LAVADELQVDGAVQPASAEVEVKEPVVAE